MNNPELCVSLPIDVIEKIKNYNKGEKMAVNARQILKKVMAENGHKSPILRTFNKGRKSLAISVTHEVRNELKANAKGAFSTYIATLIDSYFD